MTLLGVAFVVGLALGVAGLVVTTRAGKADWVWHIGRGPNRPGGQREPYGEQLNRTLQLKLDQTTRDTITFLYRRGVSEMDSIFKAQWDSSRSLRAKMDTLLVPFRAAVDSIRNDTRRSIRDMLPVPIQARYDSMVKAQDEARRRRRDFGPGGSGGQGGRGGPDGPRGDGGRAPNADGSGPGLRGGDFDRGPR
jgi:hypothetical protein